MNPFLRAPEELAQEATETIGPHAIYAILLEHLTGLAAVSFVKKATESGLLSAEEGKSLGAIVSLAAPGEAEKALEDHLPDTILLTFSALVSVRRSTARSADLSHLRTSRTGAREEGPLRSEVDAGCDGGVIHGC